MHQRRVDRAASKAALLQDGHKLKHYARDRGLNDDSFKAYFYNVFSDNAPVARMIAHALETDGYLRYEDQP